MANLNNLTKGITSFINDFTKYSGAGQAANSVSAAAQRNQGAFNQNSVNMANDIGWDRLLQQYQFNAAQAASANEWTEKFWQMQADYNAQEAEKARMFSEYMWNKNAQFNAQQAQIGRDWQEEMMATQYQRAMADMEKAGLNPILAYGGISGGVGSTPTATVSGSQSAQASASMGSGAMASGSVLNGLSASESNYAGQMEYYSGLLNMLGSLLGSMSSAYSISGALGDFGKEFMNVINDQINGRKTSERVGKEALKNKDAVKKYFIDAR